MFIAIEGIDGAGTGTQTKAIASILRKLGFEVATQEFPDHDFAIYHHLLHPFIHGQIDLEPDEAFLLFLTDMLRLRAEIGRYQSLKQKFFLADRYFATTLVYGCHFPGLKGEFKNSVYGRGNSLSLSNGIRLAETLKLTRPDLIIYLEVTPKTAVRRKHNEDGHQEGLDRFEASVKTQKIIQAKYHYLMDKSVLAPWVSLNGELSPTEVSKSMIKEIGARTGLVFNY